jgi:hypothetical protein
MMLWLQGFSEWHNKYIKEITWFFIGMFFVTMLADARKGDYVWMVIDAVIILVNYFTWANETKKS